MDENPNLTALFTPSRWKKKQQQCNVLELSLCNRVLIINAGTKIVFPFGPDKTQRFSRLPPLTPNNCGNIKMHEMGEKFKWLQDVGRG